MKTAIEPTRSERLTGAYCEGFQHARDGKAMDDLREPVDKEERERLVQGFRWWKDYLSGINKLNRQECGK